MWLRWSKTGTGNTAEKKDRPGNFPGGSVVKTMLPTQGAWVPFPVRELSHTLCAVLAEGLEITDGPEFPTRICSRALEWG